MRWTIRAGFLARHRSGVILDEVQRAPDLLSYIQVLDAAGLAGMAITYVLFDLDDTLVAEESSAEAAFLATCQHAGKRYGVDSHALHQAVRYRAREASACERSG